MKSKIFDMVKINSKFVYCCAIIIFYGCGHLSYKKENAISDSIFLKAYPTVKNKFFLTKDSLIITSKHFDTVMYSKEKFNEIIENYPELYQEYPYPPDIAYSLSVAKKNSNPDLIFDCEACRDGYYILYTYFLQKQNTAPNLEICRSKLIMIYEIFNQIFANLKHGGTFFGHQISRINGYAEYSVYQYSHYNDEYSKFYKIEKQKKLYLQLLRQKINDEIDIDNEFSGKEEKEKARVELLNQVNHLDSLITNNFYLEQAQQFHYSNY
jgi:hypothetical protein